MAQQLLFDLFFEKQPEPSVPVITPLEMRQCALGFLASKHPDAAACGVPVRFRKYKVASAAFWTAEGRTKTAAKTAVVEVYAKREHCFADCAGQKELVRAIADLRQERERLEAEIRRTEPELESSDDLFAEFSTWDYLRSRNAEYRALRHKLDKLQCALYKGSRLERIRKAAVADLLYLAVPNGLISPDEVASGWGLIYFEGNHRFSIVKEAAEQEILPEDRMLLAHNIAESARDSVYFSHGVRPLHSGRISYSRIPRRRGRLA